MKKAAYVLISIAILIIIILTIRYFENSQENKEVGDVLVESFKVSGARFLKSELYLWGRVKNNNMDSLWSIGKSVLENIGVSERNIHINKEQSCEEQQKIQVFDNKGQNKNPIISLQLDKNGNKPDESFISANLINEASNESIEGVKQKVLPVFEELKTTPQVTACIMGIFDGKKEPKLLDDIFSKVLKEVKALRVEGINDGNTLSVSAYSPLIEDSITVDGKKININLATRYNANEDRTYLWLATPIITTEY
ncbi:MAG TPA: YwmB family TATA-box binding protein [Pseudobacteroides sp.]|uniref:YwmB family TATA-box binding protein n=1 Tax=Pseudobacteroides sp. TaxID=1968840 RepID=UPI002F95EEEB